MGSYPVAIYMYKEVSHFRGESILIPMTKRASSGYLKTALLNQFMMTKHKTFPGQQPEMPVPGQKPEVKRPYDPKAPEVPEEDPEHIPEELPPRANPPEDPPLNPGSLS